MTPDHAELVTAALREVGIDPQNVRMEPDGAVVVEDVPLSARPALERVAAMLTQIDGRPRRVTGGPDQ